ncbi:MAG: hypothetical protein ABSC53_03880 [Bacteroidota bacterium]
MENLHPILRYLAMTSGLALTGIMFSLAAENWKESKYKYVYVVIASIVLTPLGAWVISTIIRIKSLQSKNSVTHA